MTAHFRCIIIAIVLFLCACSNPEEKSIIANDSSISKSTIEHTKDGFQLMVNDRPFFIQGAGLEFGSISKLAAHGANSFRTWRTDNGKRSGKEVLDEAQQYGLKVTMGIDVGAERKGFDYNDTEAVKEQLERIKKEVLELKDHPALIIWAIGNELNHHAENPKVWDAVNEISKMIHEIDTNHLTTTPLAGINKELVKEIKLRAPDLDLLSVQMYADVVELPRLIKETGWDGPFMVTEWGATGYWQVATTEWGAPIENNSSVKADFYRERYSLAIESQKRQCIGSYVFLWGQKQERTPTWFGMFMPNGNESESIDAMHFIWNNSWPKNRSPRLHSFRLDSKVALDNISLKAAEKYTAIVEVSDPDQDTLVFRWELMKESSSQAQGGDPEEIPKSLEGLIISESNGKVEIKTPPSEGAYRLFVYIEDQHEHTAHANIPFYVKD